MQDLVWTIKVDYQETRRLEYFLGSGDSREIKVGSANCDIIVNQAFPSHTTLQIIDNNFIVKAHRKLICEMDSESLILTRGKEISIPLTLETGKVVKSKIKIKDTTIHNCIKVDDQVIQNLPKQHNLLIEKYGNLVKEREEFLTLVYQSKNKFNYLCRIVKPAYVENKELIKQFLANIKNLLELEHSALPSVVEILDEKNLQLYGYVAKNFAGQSLYRRIMAGRSFSFAESVNIMKNLTQVLMFLHTKKMVHGNINPHSILIDDEGKICLTDFVFSKKEGQKPYSIPISMSHIGFTAPEQINPNNKTDYCSDVFAVAAIWYLLLTNDYPFVGVTKQEYITAEQLSRLKFPRGNSQIESHFSLIWDSMRWQSGERIKTIEEFWQGLQNIISQSNEVEKDFEEIEGDTSELFVKTFPASQLNSDISDSSGDISEVAPRDQKEIDKEPVKKVEFVQQPRKFIVNNNKKRLGNFNLQKKLGTGVLGTVYIANDITNNRQVILKIFATLDEEIDQDIRTILEETQSAANRLEHTNIAKVYEVGKCGEQYYIASEYIEGSTLEDYFKEHSISPRKSLKLICDLARIVQYIHLKGMVHRNIKPSNIIIDKEGKPYLVDFGLAKNLYLRRAHLDKKIYDALVYMPPEWDTIDSLSPTYDVYSLGTILYGLLKNDLANPNLRLSLFKSSDLAVGAEAVCERALAKEPRHRYQNAAAIADDIDRLLECKPILAKTSGWGMRLYRSNDYYRWFIWLCVVVTGIFILGYGIGFSKEDPIDRMREKAQKKYIEIEDQYYDDLKSFSRFYQQEVTATQMTTTIRNKYKTALVLEVLPYYRRCWEKGKQLQDRESLSKLLHQIILLCDEDNETQMYYREYDEVVGKKN